MNALEILFIQNLQDSLPSIGPLMKLFTFMGTFEFMMLFIPFIYWLVDRSTRFEADLSVGPDRHLYRLPETTHSWTAALLDRESTPNGQRGIVWDSLQPFVDRRRLVGISDLRHP